VRLGRVREESGFTVVESLVGGILLVIGILGGISVFDSSRRESASGERQQIAALQAQTELERLRDVPYSELELNPNAAETWTSSTGPGDPTARVVTGPPRFRTGPSQTEDLVYAAASGAGIDPQSTYPLEMGDASIDADVYRFVSWKDEECPVADLSGLVGPLEGLTDISTSLLGSMLSGGSILNTLLGPLFGLLNPVVRNRLTVARNELTSIQAALTDLVAAIEALDEIDPCDADVEALNELQDTLGPLNPLLTQLNSRINAYHAGCLKVLGVIVSCPGSTSALYTNLNATITNLQSADYDAAFDELVDSLGELSSADHTHNTKRVTVAVVLEPRTGSGPLKPVWATSVVSNPAEGLLAP
jgi:hypothetical protein